MKTLYATVSAQGQITIPAEIRRMFDIQPGARIGLVVDEDGVHFSRPLKTLAEIEGTFRPLHPMSEDFDEEIEESIADALFGERQ